MTEGAFPFLKAKVKLKLKLQVIELDSVKKII